jgi:predicted transposase/invertase (TIGR01784 family)
MISFDWALKRLLRQKANFEILEGFLSELLHRNIVIKYIGESEGNPKNKKDKTNRVDVLVEADGREIIIIELQFDDEYDYFQRMLFGVSKAITDYMHKGDKYYKVRKAYSINIVHFDLGKGNDYIYHGFTGSKGIHTGDELVLDAEQQEKYGKTLPGELHPEYYIIKVNKFDDAAKDTLDEWVYYLKNNKIKDEYTAKGLAQARELFVYDNLTDAEKAEYENEIKLKRIRYGEQKAEFLKGRREGREEGRAEGEAERARLKAEKEAAQAREAAAQSELQKLKALLNLKYNNRK